MWTKEWNLCDDLALIKTNSSTSPTWSLLVDDTKIPCTSTAIKDKDCVFVSKPINKSEINFNIYDKDNKIYNAVKFNKLIILKNILLLYINVL